MCCNGTWAGGYVYYNGIHGFQIYYVNRGVLYNPSSGCGSGCGSGCNSGSGSGSGSGTESGDGSEGGNGSGGSIISSGSQEVGGDGDVTIIFYWEPSTSVSFKAGYRIEFHPSANRKLDKIENSTLSLSYNGNKLFTLDGNISYSYEEINPVTNNVIDSGVVDLGLQIPYVTIP